LREHFKAGGNDNLAVLGMLSFSACRQFTQDYSNAAHLSLTVYFGRHRFKVALD
jgi:hypothetical protein